MNIAARPGTTGATRTCPHCKATILESSAVCPACRGHLKFDAPAVDAAQRFVPLKVEGTINAADDAAFEYTMVVVIRASRNNKSAADYYAAGRFAHPVSTELTAAEEQAADRQQ